MLGMYLYFLTVFSFLVIAQTHNFVSIPVVILIVVSASVITAVVEYSVVVRSLVVVSRAGVVVTAHSAAVEAAKTISTLMRFGSSGHGTLSMHTVHEFAEVWQCIAAWKVFVRVCTSMDIDALIIFINAVTSIDVRIESQLFDGSGTFIPSPLGENQG